MTSAFIIFTLSYSARVSARTGISLSSISIATTLSARLASSFVRTPMPVPISIMPKPFFALPISAILGQTEGFTKKF